MNNEHGKIHDIAVDLMLEVRALMVEHHVDMVAGDFNGACWRRHGRVSAIDGALASMLLLLTPWLIAGLESGRGHR